MNLKGSLARLQKSGAEFYLRLAQLFEANQLIRETWADMAQDMKQQASGLEILPSSFWKKWKEEPEDFAQTLREFSSCQTIDTKESKSLHDCFALTLYMEEPLILRAYVPLIRHLRTEFSDRALEFYIMVKAHVARLSRLIQPFADDPALLQRVVNLQENFEHEVQTPPAPPVRLKARATSKAGATTSPAPKRKTRKVPTAIKTSKKTQRALPLAKHAKRAETRPKGLVGQLEMPRRRVRR
jgi:hypothetical protein